MHELRVGSVSVMPLIRVMPRGWRTQARRTLRRLDDRAHGGCFADRLEEADLAVVLVHHASLLRRRLGETDPALQESKRLRAQKS